MHYQNFGRNIRKHKLYPATLLAFGGFLLVLMGLYFAFLRPALLPEDLSYMKTSLKIVDATAPVLPNWLHKVFMVMGGYIFTTGLLIIFIATTSFRTRVRGTFSVVAYAGLC